MDTSLQDLLLSGNLEVLKARLRPEDLNLRDANDATLLHWAARGGHVPVIEWLLSQGLSPNERDQNGETPLHVAVRHGHVEAVHTLLKAGADPNAATVTGSRPLHLAAHAGYLEIAKILIAHGAAIDDPQ